MHPRVAFLALVSGLSICLGDKTKSRNFVYKLAVYPDPKITYPRLSSTYQTMKQPAIVHTKVTGYGCFIVQRSELKPTTSETTKDALEPTEIETEESAARLTIERANQDQYMVSMVSGRQILVPRPASTSEIPSTTPHKLNRNEYTVVANEAYQTVKQLRLGQPYVMAGTEHWDWTTTEIIPPQTLTVFDGSRRHSGDPEGKSVMPAIATSTGIDGGAKYNSSAGSLRPSWNLLLLLFGTLVISILLPTINAFDVSSATLIETSTLPDPRKLFISRYAESTSLETSSTMTVTAKNSTTTVTVAPTSTNTKSRGNRNEPITKVPVDWYKQLKKKQEDMFDLQIGCVALAGIAVGLLLYRIGLYFYTKRQSRLKSETEDEVQTIALRNMALENDRLRNSQMIGGSSGRIGINGSARLAEHFSRM